MSVCLNVCVCIFHDVCERVCVCVCVVYIYIYIHYHICGYSSNDNNNNLSIRYDTIRYNILPLNITLRGAHRCTFTEAQVHCGACVDCVDCVNPIRFEGPSLCVCDSSSWRNFFHLTQACAFVLARVCMCANV